MIWVDVEDLFEYVKQNRRPSGIQRVGYELCRALSELDPSADVVRLVRSGRPATGYYSVPFALLDSHFRALSHAEARQAPMAAAPSAARPPRAGAAPHRRLRHWVRTRWVDRLPPAARACLREGYFHQLAALTAAIALAGAVGAGVAGRLRGMVGRGGKPQGEAAERAAPAASSGLSGGLSGGGGGHDDAECLMQPGDVLLLLGAPWFPGYAAWVRDIAGQKRMRLAVLMYDIVPVRHPEWCDRALIGPFLAWVGGMLPRADVLLTISHATAADIERHAAESGIALRAPPRPIRMGTGFTVHRPAVWPDATTTTRPLPQLPCPGSYALIVGTIEARKNHALLVRVWRRLLEDMPEASVPALVFAGHVGWLVGDLMTQLRNADFLRGKVVVIEHPSDADLQTLYRGCLFTLFPSYYEGWGLPVTESLSYGRPCLISSTTSLPEAGGALARYFDPDSAADAYRVIRAAIEDPEDLAAWRARIAREFRPVPWTDSARDILAALDIAAGESGGGPPVEREGVQREGTEREAAEQTLRLAV
jgi:glycosyltransferase involved in cell wall biosynthesis